MRPRLKVFHYLHRRNFPFFGTFARKKRSRKPAQSILPPYLLTCTWKLSTVLPHASGSSETRDFFSNSTGLISASHVISHGCQVTLASLQHCLQQGIIPRGSNLPSARSIQQKLAYLPGHLPKPGYFHPHCLGLMPLFLLLRQLLPGYYRLQ